MYAYTDRSSQSQIESIHAFSAIVLVLLAVMFRSPFERYSHPIEISNAAINGVVALTHP